MADQNIRVENLPDSGSREAVALALWRQLRDHKQTTDQQLDFYVDCIKAVAGLRTNDRR